MKSGSQLTVQQFEHSDPAAGAISTPPALVLPGGNEPNQVIAELQEGLCRHDSGMICLGFAPPPPPGTAAERSPFPRTAPRGGTESTIRVAMTPGTEQRKLAAVMFTDMVGYSVRLPPGLLGCCRPSMLIP